MRSINQENLSFEQFLINALYDKKWDLTIARFLGYLKL